MSEGKILFRVVSDLCISYSIWRIFFQVWVDSYLIEQFRPFGDDRNGTPFYIFCTSNLHFSCSSETSLEPTHFDEFLGPGPEIHIFFVNSSDFDALCSILGSKPQKFFVKRLLRLILFNLLAVLWQLNGKFLWNSGIFVPKVLPRIKSRGDGESNVD